MILRIKEDMIYKNKGASVDELAEEAFKKGYPFFEDDIAVYRVGITNKRTSLRIRRLSEEVERVESEEE